MATSLAGGPADAATDVLEAVARLLSNQDLHDVAFICGRDGGVVTSNKAYLAARCEYFRLLFSSAWREGGSSDVHLPHASSDALQLVLRYLFTSQLPGADVGWQTLMEACSLAQQYLLPSVVSFVAARLSSQLQPEDLGAALSYALQENLAPVVTAIWLAGPALLSCPIRLDPSYSAAAVNFLLDHSALVGSAPPGHQGSDTGSSSGGSSGINGALIPFIGGCRCTDATGGGVAAAGAPARGAKGPAAAAGAGGAAAVAGAGANAAAAAAAAAAGGAVIAGHGCWIVSEPDVLRAVLAWTEQASRCCDDCRSLRGGRCCGASGCAGAAVTPVTGDAAAGDAGDDAARPPDAGGAKRGAVGDKGAGGAAAAKGHSRTSPSAASDAAADSATAGADAAPRASTGNAAAVAAAGNAANSSGPRYCRRHQQLLCGFLCRLNLQLLDPTTLEALETAGLVSGEALVSAYRWAARCLHAALRGRFRAGAGGAGAAGGATGAAAGALGAVLGGAPVGGGAGGGAGGAGGGGAATPLCDGVFSHTKDGVEVLESRSPSHINVVTWEPLSGGRHVWTVHVRSACDLVWLGVSDGTLDPHVWGGKQAGGWLYGSNDALCSAVSDKHAYSKTCGHGKWGDGAVVTVFLDLEEGKVWFAVNGSEPRLGFSGLPPRIYPTVSIRAPAVLGFHFRAASWGSGDGAGVPAGAPLA